MDENVKIYVPRQFDVDKWNEIMGTSRLPLPKKIPGTHLKFSVGKKKKEPKNKIKVKKIVKEPNKPGETRTETLINAINTRGEQIKELEEKHPWAVIFHRWLTVLCVVSLFGGFVWWGVNLFGEAKADAAYSNGRSDVISEQKAAEEAKKNSQEAYKKAVDDLMQEDIKLMERFLGGIENFEDNPDYQYTPIDVETYGQCPINRVLDKTEFAWCNTLEGAIMQSGQWLEPFLSKVPTQRNHQIAEKLVKRLYAYQYPDLYEPDPMPCSSRYLWTEFTKNGLYLTSEYGNANFSNTWRAG